MFSLSCMQGFMDDISLWLFFVFMGGVGVLVLVLGMLLCFNVKFMYCVIIGMLLYSVVWGVVVFMMGLSCMGEDLFFLFGLVIFSGMGVVSFIDLILLLVKQWLGINVMINLFLKDV